MERDPIGLVYLDATEHGQITSNDARRDGAMVHAPDGRAYSPGVFA